MVQAQQPNQQQAAAPADKYAWLEDTHSERAMAWVKTENANSAAVLRADPHFASFEQQALQIGEDRKRLAYPDVRGSSVFNFWQDAANPRGILRTTTVADYNSAEPHWRTILDIDALNKAEGKSWVYKGSELLLPEGRYALVSLSAGGEDAVEMREFDMQEGRFVQGGFLLPRSKQTVVWVDHDTLLVARDWGPGTMTTSGYPFVVKEWKRGTALESAREVFRGKPTDVSAGPNVLKDAQGHTVQLLEENLTFFESATYVRTPDGVARTELPPKAGAVGIVDGNVLIRTEQDWTPAGGSAVAQGSLVSVPVDRLLKSPTRLVPVPVFTPTATEFLDDVTTTASHVVVTTLNHVQGGGYSYTHRAAGWTRAALSTEKNVALYIVSGNRLGETIALTQQGFITPSTLLMGDADRPATLAVVKSQPAQFDASGMTVEQLEATSKDGTRVPYFVVHRKSMPRNGQNPTLLTAYGGFAASILPSYDGTLGKLWLERGGVFVLANIRGGGEFGPAWHEAGLKTKRQRIYDDFAAVGQDLVTRRITSPRRLGIEGGSNGGLLMGVELEQHPTLWNAVVIEVPLLDMLGYEHIAAGASWVGEYGSVSVPEERKFLASISPYNNLKPDVTYPEPFIWTTTKDDRVGPEQARKFAALMEEQHHPFLLDEITEGGHGAGADIKQRATTSAETYVYLTRKLME